MVETGIPVKVAKPMQKMEARHTHVPWCVSIFTMSMPTFLMIFLPPMAVPRPMAVAHRMISQNGNAALSGLAPMPMHSMMPIREMERNFWPSCAPCISATPAPEMHWAQRQPLAARRRSVLRAARSTILVNSQPLPKPKPVEISRPYTTFIHSAPFTPSMPPCRAMAAPVRPAISEWLWEVGMPRYQVATPQTMMATIAAASASNAAWLSPPKFTMPKMVFATAALTEVTTIKPMKLHAAAIMIAVFGLMLRVPTTVAMALGASVAPFTTVAPRVRTRTTARTGLPAKADKNAPNSINCQRPPGP